MVVARGDRLTVRLSHQCEAQCGASAIRGAATAPRTQPKTLQARGRSSSDGYWPGGGRRSS